MKKVGSTLYNKLLLQAQEANDIGYEKLGQAINEAIGSVPDESLEYSYEELSDDMYKEMWKITASICNYYNVTSLDAKALDPFMEDLSKEIIAKLEGKLKLKLGKHTKEPKIIGEK